MEGKVTEEFQEVSRKETKCCIKVPREKIYLVKFLLEASGHLAFPTILPNGFIVLRYDSEREKEIKQFLKALPKDYLLEET